MAAGERESGVRLAELAAAFSLALDLGMGQPMEHVLRTWQIAARLSDRTGRADAKARANLFYIVTLAWTGCVADTPEVAAVFGDDIAYRGDSYRIDMSGLPLLGLMLSHAGGGRSPLARVQAAASLLATGGRAISQGIQSHCLTTAQLSDRLGLGPEVGGPLQMVFTRWDARGVPPGVGGESIPLPIRLFHLADVVEVHHRAGGVRAAVEVARRRRGTQFEPGLVDAFHDVASAVLGNLESATDWQAAIAAEPGLQKRLSEPELDSALEAMADFTDIRSTFRVGHSRAVAQLAMGAAQGLGLPEADVTGVRRAALVHDLGLHGLPATVLDKPGPLTRAESERLRLHTYYLERMLSQPPALARIGAIAALAHERNDGSGYHRRLTAPAIPASGRVLAAACAYQAMLEPRAHRPAMSSKQAAAELRAGVRAGRLDAAAVDAVLGAAGQAVGKRRQGPAGLTPREVEVLVLIARGASNRQVGDALNVTPKTAGTFIERIYTKTGASTRATATLFAMQHGLLETLEPLDL